MNLLKLIMGAALVVTIAFSASAAEQSRLKKILESGELRVGTTGDWNPMTMKDPATDSYTGFDIDMMKELAKDLGVEVKFIPTDWKTLVSGVLADKYDLTGSASISVGRAKVAGYSDSYFELGTVPLVLKKNLGKFQDWEDMNKAGVTVAATLGTTQEKQVKIFFPNAKKTIVDAPARDFQEVLAGRADAHITSNVEAEKLVEKYPQLAIVPVKTMRARALLAMLMAQDDHTWINFVNHWIKMKKARGFFDGLADKWKLAKP